MANIKGWNIDGTTYELVDEDAREDIAQIESDVTDLKSAITGKISAPSSPTAGQFLSWNGSAWVAASLPLYNGGVS